MQTHTASTTSLSLFDDFDDLFAFAEPPQPHAKPPRSRFEELQDKARLYGVAGLSSDEKRAYLESLPRQKTPVAIPSPAPAAAPHVSILPAYDTQHRTLTYAGIGAADTPREILQQMSSLARSLESVGYQLRTHGGCGAAAAFSSGAPDERIIVATRQHGGRALDIAREIHPAPGILPAPVLRLVDRDARIVFGDNLDAPVDALICWTRDGCSSRESQTQETGECSNTILLAATAGIPVVNMQNKHWREQFSQIFGDSVLAD